jgi:hypothetical protein
MLSYQAVVFLETFSYHDGETKIFRLLRKGSSPQYAVPALDHIANFSADDRFDIEKLFAIRIALAEGIYVSEGDQAFWDMARRQVPESKLFSQVLSWPDPVLKQETVKLFVVLASLAFAYRAVAD